MDFVLENGFYLWSKSVENFGQPGCFSDPLPSSRTRTTPQNDSQGLPTGGITPNKDLLFWEDPFLFGSFVRLLTYILDWTLNLFFPASPHVKAFACGYMFDVWTAPQEQDSISRLPLQFVFLTKTPFKSWFALFRRVILSATKILHAFPQPRHALSCVHQVMETSKELIGWSIRKMKGRKLVNKNLVVPSACFWHLW